LDDAGSMLNDAGRMLDAWAPAVGGQGGHWK